MLYQTRDMIAQREISHGRQLVREGERFQASPVDAEYLARLGHARPADDTAEASSTAAPRRQPRKTVAAEPAAAAQARAAAPDDSNDAGADGAAS